MRRYRIDWLPTLAHYLGFVVGLRRRGTPWRVILHRPRLERCGKCRSIWIRKIDGVERCGECGAPWENQERG